MATAYSTVANGVSTASWYDKPSAEQSREVDEESDFFPDPLPLFSTQYFDDYDNELPPLKTLPPTTTEDGPPSIAKKKKKERRREISGNGQDFVKGNGREHQHKSKYKHKHKHKHKKSKKPKHYGLTEQNQDQLPVLPVIEMQHLTNADVNMEVAREAANDIEALNNKLHLRKRQYSNSEDYDKEERRNKKSRKSRKPDTLKVIHGTHTEDESSDVGNQDTMQEQKWELTNDSGLHTSSMPEYTTIMSQKSMLALSDLQQSSMSPNTQYETNSHNHETNVTTEKWDRLEIMPTSENGRLDYGPTTEDERQILPPLEQRYYETKAATTSNSWESLAAAASGDLTDKIMHDKPYWCPDDAKANSNSTSFGCIHGPARKPIRTFHGIENEETLALAGGDFVDFVAKTKTPKKVSVRARRSKQSFFDQLNGAMDSAQTLTPDKATLISQRVEAKVEPNKKTQKLKAQSLKSARVSQSPTPATGSTSTVAPISASKDLRPKHMSSSRQTRKVVGSLKQTPTEKVVADVIHGRFTAEECDAIQKVIENFRVSKSMTQYEVNDLLHTRGGTMAGDLARELWNDLMAALRRRTRQKVINTVRKMYHNFVARATWTPEQDQELREAVEELGTAWVKVSGRINRHPEDIRDRWRNYLVCGDARATTVWSDEEELRLVKAVMVATDSINQKRLEEPNNANLRASYEELIDWQGISADLDRTRSRLQCITKWKSIGIPLRGSAPLISQLPGSSVSWTLEKARWQLSAMTNAEKYAFVDSIRQSGVRKVSKIPWRSLVSKDFRARFTRFTMCLFWIRLRRVFPKEVPVEDPVRTTVTHLLARYVEGIGFGEPGDAEVDDEEENAALLEFESGTFRVGKVKQIPLSDEMVCESDSELRVADLREVTAGVENPSIPLKTDVAATVKASEAERGKEDNKGKEVDTAKGVEMENINRENVETPGNESNLKRISASDVKMGTAKQSVQMAIGSKSAADGAAVDVNQVVVVAQTADSLYDTIHAPAESTFESEVVNDSASASASDIVSIADEPTVPEPFQPVVAQDPTSFPVKFYAKQERNVNEVALAVPMRRRRGGGAPFKGNAMVKTMSVDDIEDSQKTTWMAESRHPSMPSSEDSDMEDIPAQLPF